MKNETATQGPVVTELGTETRLPRSGALVRVVREVDGAIFLYIADGDEVLDVAVAHQPRGTLLRGAVCGERAGARWALAWGPLAPNGPEPAVVFSGPETLRSEKPLMLAGAFWVAEAGGELDSVSVAAGFDRATARLRGPAETAAARWAAN